MFGRPQKPRTPNLTIGNTNYLVMRQMTLVRTRSTLEELNEELDLLEKLLRNNEQVIRYTIAIIEGSAAGFTATIRYDLGYRLG